MRVAAFCCFPQPDPQQLLIVPSRTPATSPLTHATAQLTLSLNIVMNCLSGRWIPGAGDRDAFFVFKHKLLGDLSKPEAAIAVDLAGEEETEAAERAVRLRVLKKIVSRRAETKSLPDEQRKIRLEFERQKVRNRDIVNRWRNRFGRHRTVHQLDRSERIRSENRTIEDKLDGMVREVLVMKARFVDLLERHRLQQLSSNGKRRLLPEEKVVEINNWLDQVPGMLQKVAESQATPVRNERKKPESSECLVRESRKTIRLRTESIPITSTRSYPSELCSPSCLMSAE